MADPFSVASGAVGVISLGLTLCQGLIAYYAPFSAYDSETKNLVIIVEGLKATLESLSSKASGFENTQASHLTAEVLIVTERIKDCEKGLQDLSRTLEKCRTYDAPGKLKEKGWNGVRKALYPFKQGTLLSLVRMASGLQSNLDTALILLQLALAKQIEENTSLTLTVSHSIAASASDLATSLDELLRRQQQTEILRRQEQAEILRVQEQTQQQIQTMIRLQQYQNGVAIQRSLPSLQPPSSLKSLCDQQQVISHRLLAPDSPVRRFQNSRCTCFSNLRRSPTKWSIFQNMSSHQLHCPSYLDQETVTLLRKRFVMCNRFLKFSVNLHLNATYGAGGFSIHPILNIRSVVPYGNMPSADVVENGIMQLASGTSSENIFGDMLVQLQQLFEERKASPMDTLPNGDTLLHRSLSMVSFIPQDHLHEYRNFIREIVVSFHVPLNEQAFGEGSNHSGTPIDVLISNAGVERSTLNQSLPHLVGLASDLVSLDAIFTSPFPVLRSTWIPPLLVETPKWRDRNDHSLSRVPHLILSGLPDLWFQDLPFTEIQVAVLQRSENDLERLLQRFNEADMPPGIKAAFRASVAWPKGLQMFLAKINNQNWISRAMREAIATSQMESVDILLNTGRCPISSRIFIDAAETFFDPSIFRAIVLCIVHRRESLLTAARLQLPRDVMKQLDIPPSLSIPDRQTIDLYRALGGEWCRLGSHIIEKDYISAFSVYSLLSSNLNAADILFKAGFIHVGGDDSPNMYAPLLDINVLCVDNWRRIPDSYYGDTRRAKNFLAICQWLLDKGASLFSKSPGTYILPAHHVAREIGRAFTSFVHRSITADDGNTSTFISDFWEYCSRVFSQHTRLLNPLLMDSLHKDQCLCACSRDGCLSSTMLLNRMIQPIPSHGFKHSRFLATFIEMLQSIGTATLRGIHDALAPVVIRLCTFKQMELTHTCGDNGHSYEYNGIEHVALRDEIHTMSEDEYSDDQDSGDKVYSKRKYEDLRIVHPDDVAAIREEERSLIDRLEELVAEFECKYAELAIPLPEFLTGYWESRMSEVDAKENIFNEEEARKMIEVGVIV